jgi:DNA topoisomerase-1
MTLSHATLNFARESQARAAAVELTSQTLTVIERQSRIVEEAPPLPYTTLDLLEDAALRLGWSARKTMAEAQSLFEAGRITYPRTDSMQVAAEAVEAVREVISRLYGSKALSPDPNRKSRMVVWRLGKQTDISPETAEAHEAIRPTDPGCQPEELQDLEKDCVELYRLIWERFLASQMRPARYQMVEVTLRRSP